MLVLILMSSWTSHSHVLISSGKINTVFWKYYGEALHAVGMLWECSPSGHVTVHCHLQMYGVSFRASLG